MSITNLDEMHPMLPFSSKPMYNMNLPIKRNLNTVVLQDKYHKKFAYLNWIRLLMGRAAV